MDWKWKGNCLMVSWHKKLGLEIKLTAAIESLNSAEIAMWRRRNL